MKKKFIFLAVLIIFSLPLMAISNKRQIATSIEESPYDQAVSLGNMCQVASQLKKNGVRNQAYPFDWLISPITAIESFIINDGSHFLDKETLIYKTIRKTPPHSNVIDSHYGFNLIHDFFEPENIDNYNAVKLKYERRCERFFNLLNSDKKVLLIRIRISKAEAIHLNDLLQAKYPNLNYTLLVLNDSKEFKSTWGIPRIENFYIPLPKKIWYGDDRSWKRILGLFNISKSNNSAED